MDKIRNLSLRKTMLLYMTVGLIAGFLLSSWISVIAWHTQAGVWRKYMDYEEYYEIANTGYTTYLTDVVRPPYGEMTSHDRFVSELCDFLQTYAILILSMIGSCASVFLFYRNKLKYPIAELALASQYISQNNLRFQIIYENKDEMGRLCQEFERMRAQLAENNILLWRSLEEERALRAAIAHDLRSPLSVLKGYHEMLTDYLPDETIDLKKAMDMLSECGKQLNRMDAFVETMRKLSSLERRELHSDEITAAQLQEELRSECRILEKESGRQITLQVSPQADTFIGDKEIILEVTENLLSNALRYAKKEVTLTLFVSSPECRVCVTDDGVGFSSGLEDVTKAFYQQNAMDSLKHAGMGMYISRLYCEKHGGRLLLENRPHGGASVTAVFCRIA